MQRRHFFNLFGVTLSLALIFTFDSPIHAENPVTTNLGIKMGYMDSIQILSQRGVTLRLTRDASKNGKYTNAADLGFTGSLPDIFNNHQGAGFIDLVAQHKSYILMTLSPILLNDGDGHKATLQLTAYGASYRDPNGSDYANPTKYSLLGSSSGPPVILSLPDADIMTGGSGGYSGYTMMLIPSSLEFDDGDDALAGYTSDSTITFDYVEGP